MRSDVIDVSDVVFQKLYTRRKLLRKVSRNSRHCVTRITKNSGQEIEHGSRPLARVRTGFGYMLREHGEIAA